MADEGQVVTFESDEARAKAIDGFDESTGKVEDLQKIRDAEVVVPEKSEETTETQEGKVEETTTIQKEKTEETTVTPKELEKKEETEEKVVEAPVEFTIKKEDLPLNYDTPGKVFKSIKEKEDLIQRQAEKIQTDQVKLDEALRRAEAVGAKVQEVAPEKKAEVAEIAESKMSDIAQKKQTLVQMEDPYSEAAVKLRTELDGLMFDEVVRLNTVTKNYQDEFATLKTSTEKFHETYEQGLQEGKNKTALESEYVQMDDFGSKYDDYKLSKSSKEIEKEYIEWGTKVATQYFGRLPKDMAELNHALNTLFLKSPDLINRCELAQIAVDPTDDLRKYTETIKLMDYRDGIRKNTDGTVFRVTKYDPYLKKDVPDTFPSIEAALENKRVTSGYYKDKEHEAYKKGGKDTTEAIMKRDNSELDNTQAGHAQTEALTLEQATKRHDEIDEMEAMRLYMAGDKTLLEELSRLRVQLGGGAIDMTGF